MVAVGVSACRNGILVMTTAAFLLLSHSTLPAQQPNPASDPQQRYYAALAEGVKGPNLRRTETVGLPTGKEFTDLRPEGGFLVGFDLWKANYKKALVVNGIRPIYLTQLGKFRGNAYGHSDGEPITVEAKEGFAVAGMEVHSADRMDQVRVIFMRYKVGLDGFNSDGAYKSEWIGGPSQPKEHRLIPDQKMIVGIFGGSGLGLDHFGLLYLDHR
jgi:hypothetical protein